MFGPAKDVGLPPASVGRNVATVDETLVTIPLTGPDSLLVTVNDAGVMVDGSIARLKVTSTASACCSTCEGCGLIDFTWGGRLRKNQLSKSPPLIPSPE